MKKKIVLMALAACAWGGVNAQKPLRLKEM